MKKLKIEDWLDIAEEERISRDDIEAAAAEAMECVDALYKRISELKAQRKING